MDFLEFSLVGLGLLCLGIFWHESRKRKKRQPPPLSFDDGISQLEFASIVKEAAHRTPRVIAAKVEGMTAKIHYKSISGLTEWHAEVNFNDDGHLTGSYWISAEDPDSKVLSHFAREVRTQIETRTSSHKVMGSPRVQEASPEGFSPNHMSTNATHSSPPGWYYTGVGPRYWNGFAWISPGDTAPHIAYPPSSGVSSAPHRPTNPTNIVLAWLIAFVTCGYMLPWAIAVTRETTNQNSVALVCFCTGWTGVGWIIALVMASIA